MNSMSSHSCAPTHDPTMLPTSSILLPLPFYFPGIFIPSFVRTREPEEEFLHMAYSSWHPQAALHNAESARISPVYRRIKTYYIKSFGQKNISSKMLDLFGLFLKAQVVPCLHESFIQGLYKQTQERQQCFKQLLWTK